MSTDRLIPAYPYPITNGRSITARRPHPANWHADGDVHIAYGDTTHTVLSARESAAVGAALIAAAAVASGRLDSANVQAVLDAAQAAVLAQVRAEADRFTAHTGPR